MAKYTDISMGKDARKQTAGPTGGMRGKSLAKMKLGGGSNKLVGSGGKSSKKSK
jgi:hypothetical protein